VKHVCVPSFCGAFSSYFQSMTFWSSTMAIWSQVDAVHFKGCWWLPSVFFHITIENDHL
jgi:hypothetical protein